MFRVCLGQSSRQGGSKVHCGGEEGGHIMRAGLMGQRERRGNGGGCWGDHRREIEFKLKFGLKTVTEPLFSLDSLRRLQASSNCSSHSAPPCAFWALPLLLHHKRKADLALGHLQIVAGKIVSF